MGWNHQLAMVLSHYFFQGFGIHPNGGGLALHGISEALKMVFLSFYYTLENEHGSWKSPVWKGSSSSKPSFLGSMLIFRGVSPFFLIHWFFFGGGEISTNRQIHLRSLEAFAGLKRFQFRVLVCTVPGPRTKVWEVKGAMKKTPGWLGYIGDYTTQLYRD